MAKGAREAWMASQLARFTIGAVHELNARSAHSGFGGGSSSGEGDEDGVAFGNCHSAIRPRATESLCKVERVGRHFLTLSPTLVGN